MSKNKMKQIAELLGVELYEEFYIRHSGTREKYRFTEKGLEYHYNIEGWGWANSCLIEIFTGEFEIIKTPWKPKCLDEFWYIRANGTIGKDRWCDVDVDNLFFKLGNAYKTEEEASKNVTRYLKFLETASSWRAENNETNDSEVETEIG